jgi:hypothetical protein
MERIGPAGQLARRAVRELGQGGDPTRRALGIRGTAMSTSWVMRT